MKKIVIYSAVVFFSITCLMLLLGFKHWVPNNRSAAAKESFYFLFLSDVHLVSDQKSSAYGGDSGIELWQFFKTKLDSIVNSPNPPAFILYTGDMPEHNISIQKRSKDIKAILGDLEHLSNSGRVPLFYLPGNNDGLSGDYCFFSDAKGKSPFSLRQGFSPYPYQFFHIKPLSTDTNAHIISGSHLTDGYYSAGIMKGLRIVCLNSVLWSSVLCKNCQQNCSTQQKKGTEQMEWLERQLAAADSAGDKAFIAMHVPPGVDAYSGRQNPQQFSMMWNGTQPRWQTQFMDKVKHYKKAITGIFYGHTHMDEFRILCNSSVKDSLLQVAISCPAVSPQHYNNPGFKLVFIDANSKMPIDFATYFTAVPSLKWQSPYKFSDLPGVKPDLTIIDAIRTMTDKERKNALDAIYTVKYPITMKYDTLGLYVH